MYFESTMCGRSVALFFVALGSASIAVACGEASDPAIAMDEPGPVFAQSVAGLDDVPTAFELELPETITPFSGRINGDVVTRSRSYTSNDVVVGVKAGERSNDPCYLRLLYRDVATGSEPTRTYDKCVNAERSVITRELPEGYLMTGIRICLNRSRTKLKGIQLIGGPAPCIVDNNGTYWSNSFGTPVLAQCTPAALEVDRYFERTNCKGGSFGGPDDDWETERNCQPGSVVTGFRLNEVDGGGARHMINGISLICHQIFPD